MPDNIYVLYGEDEFSVKEALTEVKKSLGDQEALASNTNVLDGKSLTFAELQMTCASMPFFAEHRLIVVENLLERFDGGGGRKSKKKTLESKGNELGDFAGLTTLPNTTPPQNVIVLLSGNLRATNAAVDALRGMAKIMAAQPLQGKRLQDWITMQTPKHGATIDLSAARLLAEYSTGNLRQLDNDIEKLSLYATGRPIQETDIQLLVHSSREARIFDLIDAAVQGNRNEAVRALEQMFIQGEPVQIIITMLTRQLRLMVQSKLLSEQRASRSEMAEALGTNSDFVIEKTLQQTQRYSFAMLKSLYQRLLDADVSIKVGALDEQTAVELFVTELAGTAK